MTRRTGRRAGPYRAIVTDVDGTLTDRSRRVDPGAMRLLNHVERRGIPVVLATGNVLPVALGLQRALGITGPIVAENGGLLYQEGSGGHGVVRLADPHPARAALRALRAAGLPVRPLFTNRWRETEVALEPTVPLTEIRRCLRGHRVLVESTGFAIHLMARGAGKRPAVGAALRPLGLTLADCVVLGDGDNDVPMLRAAGFGVSFPTASPRARSAAGYVTRRGYGPGFVEGLKASGVVD